VHDTWCQSTQRKCGFCVAISDGAAPPLPPALLPPALAALLPQRLDPARGGRRPAAAAPEAVAAAPAAAAAAPPAAESTAAAAPAMAAAPPLSEHSALPAADATAGSLAGGADADAAVAAPPGSLAHAEALVATWERAARSGQALEAVEASLSLSLTATLFNSPPPWRPAHKRTPAAPPLVICRDGAAEGGAQAGAPDGCDLA